MEQRMFEYLTTCVIGTYVFSSLPPSLPAAGQIDREQYPSLYDFVKAQGLSPKLEEFILYSISLANTDQAGSQNIGIFVVGHLY